MIAIVLCLSLQDGFTDRELAALDETLHALNMRRTDLAYRKGPITDPSRLPLVDRLLHDPLSIPAASGAILEPTRKSSKPSQLIALLAAHLPGGDKLAIDDLAPLDVAAPRDLPDGFAPILARLAGAVRAARKEAAAAGAPALDLRGFVADEDELGFPAAPKDVWKALDAVRWTHLWRAGLFLATEIERAVEALVALKSDWRGVARVEDVVVAGTANDRHDQSAAIIIDLGGDDTYVGDACQAWIVDCAGHDRYRAGHVSLGSAILDVRALWDRGGDDVYEGESMTQAFAAFGIGVLLDDAGNDTYRAQLYAQGASRTWGAALLADRAGDDVYQAGGRIVHKPLLEKERATFGFAQGFSIGYRPDRSGGLAVLWDGAGDDTYVGGTYTQGASYWFSFALLADDAGNDKYTAFYYSQASAMHLTVAALLDRAGNDLYACHMGAIHAIGHDWGVALLWDREGNDVYAGDSAPCVGVANGVGVFVDGGGDDKYAGPPAQGLPARDSGSVAVFVDLGGNDRYGRGLTNGGLALRGTWGAARDVEDPPKPPDAQPADDPLKGHAPPGSRACPSEAELAKLYDEASLWAVGSTRDRAWAARRTLIEIGVPAARWMLKQKLASAQSLNIEAFQTVLRAIGAEAGKLLVEPLRSSDRAELENALRLVVAIKATDTREEIVRLLREKPERMVIGAAGALALKEAVPAIIDSAKNPDPFLHLSIAKALGQIGDASAVDWLAARFDGAELPVREAAADALVKIGATERLSRLAKSESTVVCRLAIRALGQLNAVDAVRARVADPDWGVRLSVLRALKAMKAEGYAEALAAEKDVRVKRAMESLDAKDQW